MTPTFPHLGFLMAQAASELGSLADLIQRAGLGTIIAVLVVGGFRGWYVFGPTHKTALEDKDRQLAEAGRRILALEAKLDQWQDKHVRVLTAGTAAVETIDQMVTRETKA